MIFAMFASFYIVYRFYIKNTDKELVREGIYRFCMVNIILFYVIDSVYANYFRFGFLVVAFIIFWWLGLRAIEKKKDLDKNKKVAGNLLIIASIIATLAQALAILFVQYDKIIYSFDREHINIVLILIIIFNIAVRLFMDKKLIKSCLKTSLQRKIFVVIEIIFVLIVTGWLIYNIVNVGEFRFVIN